MFAACNFLDNKHSCEPPETSDAHESRSQDKHNVPQNNCFLPLVTRLRVSIVQY